MFEISFLVIRNFITGSSVITDIEVESSPEIKKKRFNFTCENDAGDSFFSIA